MRNMKLTKSLWPWIYAACLVVLPVCLCDDETNITRPSFPDTFQIEVEGTFIREDGVVDVTGSLYYDRKNNRAAFIYTSQNSTAHLIFDFEADQRITISDDQCGVRKIPDDPNDSFFAFTKDEDNKKKIVTAEDFLLFRNSELDKGRTTVAEYPQLIYTTTTAIPKYEETNCEIIHTFSKPILTMDNCDYSHCVSTLMHISVRCIDDESGNTTVDHNYHFYRYRPRILDESVFFSDTGVYCKNMKSKKPFPKFPSYFSFTFDVSEKIMGTEDSRTFLSHKKIWYDSDYNILRVDEFDHDQVRLATRVYDIEKKAAFQILATMNKCPVNKIVGDLELDEVTTLPDIFFNQEANQEDSVYVGKRKINELDYDVWSFSWEDNMSFATKVENVYFSEVVENQDQNDINGDAKPRPKVTHVNEYTYEQDDEMGDDYFSAFKLFSINDFRSNPREWEAFDISPCFNNDEQKTFRLRVNGSEVVPDSHVYHEIIEKLYQKLVTETGISMLRINRLRGVFDGVHMTEIKGSILDYSIYREFMDLKQEEPGMNESINRIKKASADGKLSISLGSGKDKVSYDIDFLDDSNPDKKTTTPDPDKETTTPTPDTTGGSSGYSGAAMAATGVVLLVVGIAFGVAGYYVFLKKRSKAPSETHVQFSNLR